MFGDPDFCPDELKVYPCSLIESAELMQVFQRGDWQPYTHDELLRVLAACFMATPEYCRLTRVIRDIPGTDIVEGNKMTNYRQIVEQHLAKQGLRSPDIRARETRFNPVQSGELSLDEYVYPRPSAKSISCSTSRRRARSPDFGAGAARPRHPAADARTGRRGHRARGHVYRQALGIGENVTGRPAQRSARPTGSRRRHRRERGYKHLAVISAVGTRPLPQTRLNRRRHVSGARTVAAFSTLRRQNLSVNTATLRYSVF